MLNITTTTLRNWEERYGLVVPTRSPGGHRLYSRKQVDELRFLATQVQAGLQPAEAHRLLIERTGQTQREPLSVAASTPEHALVLIVECSPHAAELCEQVLHASGYRVELATSAAEALPKAAELKPHLNLVELLVDGGGGAGLCGHLRTQTQAPVLAVSSLRPAGDPHSYGADAFLQKPLDPTLLTEAVERLVAGGRIEASMTGQPGL
jgi:CheY-like chemotaxis protein